MNIGDKIKQLRNERELSTYDLSEKTGISQSTISKLENNKRKADIDILQKIADALEIPIDVILGRDISSIIEKRIGELGITIEDVAEKTKLSLEYLNNLSNIAPEYWDYDNIRLIASTLGIPQNILITALSKQEPPTYNGPVPTAEDAFKDSIKEKPARYNTNITDIKQAMEIILAQPGLMLNGEMLSDESKIALANAINMGLAYAEQMQEEEKKNTKDN